MVTAIGGTFEGLPVFGRKNLLQGEIELLLNGLSDTLNVFCKCLEPSLLPSRLIDCCTRMDPGDHALTRVPSVTPNWLVARSFCHRVAPSSAPASSR